MNNAEKMFHEIVWNRFVRLPFGHVLDYAGKNGEAYYPTAEECEKSIPNPRSWGLPVENGAFFTGLYAYALLEKYSCTKCEQTAEEIKILMNGLFLLQDVGRVEGFIARGVADDGISHYPMSAECQIFPWTLAMYAYYKADLCVDKQEVKERILRVLTALRSYNWQIPCDEEGVFYKGSWLKSESWRSVVMLIYSSRVIYELTQDKKELELFEKLLNENPGNSIFTRAEIISQGCAHDMITSFGNQMWICTYTHLAVRELYALTNEEIYKKGLYNTGVTALRNVSSITRYDNKAEGFDINWRPLNDLWEDYEKDTTKGTEIASRQFAYWHEKIVPHRHMEHGVLGNALFSVWVAVTCEERRICDRALKILYENYANIDWENMHLSYAFVGESALIFGN